MRARASGACCSFITHDSPSNAIHVHFFVQDTAYLRPLVDVKDLSPQHARIEHIPRGDSNTWYDCIR